MSSTVPSSRAESGQALIETALFALSLMILLVGGIDFGRFSYEGILLGNAARAGVQYGSQNLVTAKDVNGMKAAAGKDGINLLGLSTSATQYCQANGSNIPCSVVNIMPGGQPRLVYVTVTTSGTFTPLISFPGIASSLTITRTAVMQVGP
jgi:Flp pilus assembly protein TadG